MSRDVMTIGKRLAKVRKTLGHNQVTFAGLVEVSQSAFKNYERGATDIPIALAVRVCKDYSISPSWLLTGEGEMISPNYSEAVERAVIKTREYIKEHGYEVSELKEAQIIVAVFENIINNQTNKDNILSQLMKVAS